MAMTLIAVRRSLVLFSLAGLIVIGGCARTPSTGVTPLKPATSTELETRLLAQRADVEGFRLRGPFNVNTREGFELRLSAKERITGDLYLSEDKEKAPLVILLHGYGNSKDDHGYQAMHLATWGIHTLALQMTNKGAWAGNGRTLARIINFIHRNPDSVDSRIDPKKIILVGHSFGATSVAVALAERPPAAGAILLDPAAIGKGLPSSLGKIETPVMVLGADERISSARGRDVFYRYIRRDVAEISIRGAAHEDAEFPLEAAPITYGDDTSPTEEHQITFVAALTSAAFSLASTGRFDYAWTSFGSTEKNGRFIDPRKK